MAVAFAESVMAVELLTVRMVVPDGMSVPVILWPATSPVVLLIPVTDADPLVSVPVKTTGWGIAVVDAWTAVAVRLWEPPAVALAESVMLALEVLIVRIVVPDGMPGPVMLSADDQSRRTTDSRDGRRSARQGAREVDELDQLDGIARWGRAEERRRTVAGDIVADNPRIVGGVKAEVGHGGRRRVVDLERDGIAHGRAEPGVLGIRRIHVDLERPIEYGRIGRS